MNECEYNDTGRCEDFIPECCDCGGEGCECPDCWTCNACYVCLTG